MVFVQPSQAEAGMTWVNSAQRGVEPFFPQPHPTPEGFPVTPLPHFAPHPMDGPSSTLAL
jgi:hypothetical protein